MYGQRKQFETTAGIIFADTKAEAIQMAEATTTERPISARGPKAQPSLRELGVRAQVRRMNRAGL